VPAAMPAAAEGYDMGAFNAAPLPYPAPFWPAYPMDMAPETQQMVRTCPATTSVVSVTLSLVCPNRLARLVFTSHSSMSTSPLLATVLALPCLLSPSTATRRRAPRATATLASTLSSLARRAATPIRDLPRVAPASPSRNRLRPCSSRLTTLAFLLASSTLSTATTRTTTPLPRSRRYRLSPPITH
jgi:hypothetical protein